MKISTLGAVLVLAALTGCAASGPKFSAQESGTPRLSADKGRVYFYRPSGMMGAGLQPEILLDGKMVGKSQPGGYFYVDADAGSHEAQTSTEVTNKLSFVVDKGEVKYVRTKVSMGVLVGHVTPELVGKDEARAEIGDLSYTGAARAN
jgi:hypothetical protein